MISAPTRRMFLGGLAAAAASGWTTVASAADATLATFSDGSLTLPAGMLASQVGAEDLQAELKAAGLRADVNVSPLNVTLLRRGADVILFDCGSGQNFQPSAGKLADSLAAAGVSTESITHVLFTHAHPDHLWGALDDFGTPAFPKARYLMAAAERDFWLASDVYGKLPEDRHAFAAGAQRVIKELDSTVEWFRAGEEVAPGVLAFETRGHTPGHVSFETKVGADSVLVLGDALTHPVISFRRPEWAGGSDQEPERASATRKIILDRAAGEKLKIVGYHLPDGGVGRVERSGAAYRFVSGG